MRISLLLLILSLSGCADKPPALTRESSAGPQVAVIERGLHADLALPVDRIQGAAGLAQLSPQARYLVIGFGDRDYYLSPSGKLVGVFAAFWPGPGALLVTALKTAPEEAFAEDDVIEVPMNQAGFDRIALYVWNSFRLEDGVPRALGEGPYPGSAFYATDRIYGLFDNCNSWVAAGLAEGGVQIDPEGIFLARQIMNRLKAYRQGGAVPSEQTAVEP